MRTFDKRVTAVLCCCAISIVGCSDGTPIVMESHEYASPDGKVVAVLEVVDNGLGFGLGALYEEVHIVERGAGVERHGKDGTSVVFYAESKYGKGQPVQVNWVTPTRLRIAYDASATPGKETHSMAGVTVEYAPVGKT